jgi:hypothetical protein
MDKEAIKEELIRECELMINSTDNAVKRASGFNKLEALGNHIGSTDEFSKKIIDKLNEILVAKNLRFDGESDETEKNELVTYLKPTIIELIRKYIAL